MGALEFIDTHCHIHSIGADSGDLTTKKWHDGGVDNAGKVIVSAAAAGVTRLICVGTDLQDSQRAVEFVQKRENCYAAVGVHPHEAKKYFDDGRLVFSSKRPFRHDFEDYIAAALRLESLELKNLNDHKVVAIGEVGLDYYYEHSPKQDQIKLLEYFLDLAQTLSLPLIFHVRDAHADFWPVFDNFKNIRGVLHSFSAGERELEEGLKRGLYIGLNGIMTFTNDSLQLEAAKSVPADRLLLETDAPYLTPKPFRGKVCKPEHVVDVAKFLGDLRGEPLQNLASQTTQNGRELFHIA